MIPAVMPEPAEWLLVHSAQRENVAPTRVSFCHPTQSVGAHLAIVTWQRSALANLRIAQLTYSSRMAPAAIMAKPIAILGSARHTMPSARGTLEPVSLNHKTLKKTMALASH